MRPKPIGEAYSSQSSSCAARVEESLSAYELVQARTNAFLELTAEHARQRADRADVQLRQGARPRPLEGFLIGYKDMFDYPGRRCTFGSALPQEEAPDKPAVLIQNLELMGAISIGFLNMSEFALGPTGHNRTFGHCRNPWNDLHVSGGSSSGSAAAVASGIVDGAVGSDTGGSIRIPAACCGIVGLKTTQGRLSSGGAMPLSPSLDCFGPLAPTAEACEKLFAALLPLDRKELDRERHGVSQTPVRIIYPRREVESHSAPEIVKSLDAAIEVFRSFASITEASLPDVAGLHAQANIIQTYESAAIHADRIRSHRAAYTSHVLKRIEPGFEVESQGYRAAQERRKLHLRHFQRSVLTEDGVLVTPTVGIPIPQISETDEEEVGAIPELVATMTRWTRWINFLGVPALSLPCGVDSRGLPIGLQLVGNAGSEFQLLGIAKRFQAITDWHSKQPPIG